VQRRVAALVNGLGVDGLIAPEAQQVLDDDRRAAARQWFVAFALEPGADPRRAFAQIEAKRCDLIVVNDVSAIESARTAVTIFDRAHAKVGSRAGTKTAVASWLVRVVEQRLMG
jgi:phosphopantothenoylcysteine synthetase/decarboxylase